MNTLACGKPKVADSKCILIFLEVRIADSGIAWKGEESHDVIGIPADDIKWAQWIRVARNYQLRIGTKERKRETFDGFSREVRFLIGHPGFRVVKLNCNILGP